jgi:EAL domain-containing protein (putative c-di-GMP-specific phosphodiesterase class I)/CheY-like chemotaxis protein
VDRLLVVDDDPNVLAGICRGAGRHFEIEIFASGETAIRRVMEGARYDAIVSDQMMAGMDGVTFLERVREISASTPRILLTGHADQGVMLDAINRASVSAFLKKPVPASKLIAALRKAIDDARSSQAAPASLTDRQGSLAAELARADLDGQFRLVFQPRICGGTGALVSSEALLRWNHPRLGLVSPLEFIPVAEASGQIDALTMWVLRQAARAQGFLARGGLNIPVSVNVSVSTLESPRFADRVLEILAAAGMPPGRLELEITESTRLRKTETVRGTVTAMRDAGIRIALDDFGTGYSFFETLRWLDIDCLKVDRSFVGNLSNSGKNQKIVSSIVDLADSLNLTVIAEGVETPEQVALLHGLGVKQLQGYFFARPMPVEDLLRIGLPVRDHRAARGFGHAAGETGRA